MQVSVDQNVDVVDVDPHVAVVLVFLIIGSNNDVVHSFMRCFTAVVWTVLVRIGSFGILLPATQGMIRFIVSGGEVAMTMVVMTMMVVMRVSSIMMSLSMMMMVVIMTMSSTIGFSSGSFWSIIKRHNLIEFINPEKNISIKLKS